MKIGDVQCAKSRGCKKGYERVSISATSPATRTGKPGLSGNLVNSPMPQSPTIALCHWASKSVPREDTAS
ncbi:hypothetical protein ASZ90_008183 [hydrocarbon metagenome]|uniref:Uncharacterized protein n=1 Tax=hydrocarbon metagenome TaxID=938273 RepID=A0A0W8FMR0_9ZZZZ